MELKNQVVSLDLAKKMKELGFEQESAFYWRNAGQVGWQLENEVWMRNKKEAAYSAYTVAELGEMLPVDCFTEKTHLNGSINYCWTCRRKSIDGYSHIEYADTETDARAKMLIYLKEQKLI